MILALILALIVVLLVLGAIWLLVYRETAADIPAAKPRHSESSAARNHRPHPR